MVQGLWVSASGLRVFGFRVGPNGFMEYSVLEGLGAPGPIKSEATRIWVVLRITGPFRVRFIRVREHRI